MDGIVMNNIVVEFSKNRFWQGALVYNFNASTLEAGFGSQYPRGGSQLSIYSVGTRYAHGT